MAAPSRLVQVVIEVGASRHDAVDIAVLDEVRQDQPQSTRAEGAGDAKENRAVIAEHALPDPAGGCQVAALEGNLLHPRQHLAGSGVRGDYERLDRRSQEAGLL